MRPKSTRLPFMKFMKYASPSGLAGFSLKNQKPKYGVARQVAVKSIRTRSGICSMTRPMAIDCEGYSAPLRHSQ